MRAEPRARRGARLPRRRWLAGACGGFIALGSVLAISFASASAPPAVTLVLGSAVGNHTHLFQDAAVYVSSASTPTATVDVTPGSGLTIRSGSVVLQYQQVIPGDPINTSPWVSFRNPVTTVVANSDYASKIGYSSFLPGPGLYNVRAQATDSSGTTGTSAVSQDVSVVDDEGQYYGGQGQYYAGLEPLNSAVHGTVPLTAAIWSGGPNPGSDPTQLTFELSPTGQENFTYSVTAQEETDASGNPVTQNGMALYTTSVDTTQLSDGAYDLTVTGQDGNGNPVAGEQISDLTIDNTAPTVSLATPGSSLSGLATLSADATAGISGIASVRFEYAPSGSTDWTTVGLASSAPYSESFNTYGLTNGSYDLRAIATTGAGISTASTVSTVEVNNSSPGYDPTAVTDTPIVTPASHLGMLGELSDSADHETWAYGYTDAAAAVVDGQPLPYTAPSGSPQLVLLRYTDQTGWQIADVLRNADGTAFPIGSGAITVQGEMEGSGEAWIVLTQGGVTSLFHRAPGGQFRLDSGDTSTLTAAGLLTGDSQLHLGAASDGSVYGTLTDTDQSAKTIAGVTTKLKYGELAGGTWTVQSATVPPGFSGSGLDLEAASPSGPGSGWGIFSQSPAAGHTLAPLVLGSFGSSGWSYVTSTGLDALDLTGEFALAGAEKVGDESGNDDAIALEPDGVWIEASLGGLGGVQNATYNGKVIALFDPSTGHVTASWCATQVFNVSTGCAFPLDANHPAAVPDAEFQTGQGPVALALGDGVIDAYANGIWSTIPAPGFTGGQPGADAFSGAASGWLAGTNSVGALGTGGSSSPLVAWPVATQSTLLSIALPPSGAAVGQSGALAVGLDGTAVHYDASAGWLTDPVPARAQTTNLLGVAFNGPSSAVAVGSFGTILDWNGSTWSTDSASGQATNQQLNAVAFAPDGEGWAVGAYGTILHDTPGGTWTPETIDAADSGQDVTSVTVAGSQVFAVAGGNLITRAADGTWSRVASSLLPSGLEPGTLKLVSGLPDGGVVAAGTSVVIERSSAGASFAFSDQPLPGVAVAVQAFRDGSGDLRAYVSVAPPPPADDLLGLGSVFPSGDGDLLVETAGGWQDLSRDQYPSTTTPANADGVPEPDPVLAVAGGADSAWAVGGYAGTQTAVPGVGLSLPISQIPKAWQTASIWRYDSGGSASPSGLSQNTVSLPAQSSTVSFAFFSSNLCQDQCTGVQNAQPDANLVGAAQEISAFAAQPGGPAFAMEGGDAVGPIDGSADQAGNGAADLANFTNVLGPLGNVPLYGALGPLDAVPTSTDPDAPWASAFAQQPAPFGQGAVPNGVASDGGGGADGSVNRYYAFDVTQNGGTLRAIVLDNADGSLDASSPGQSAWLAGQLASAQSAGLPVVVFASQPLDDTYSGGDALAAELADAGVLAVFTTPGGTSELDSSEMVPTTAAPGAPQIPDYEGGTLGYQQTQNNGVLWYFVSVDTATSSLTVQGIPVIQSLALQPLDGLTAARSSTLSFVAVGRRPAGTLPVGNVQGYANYVSIPSSSCTACVTPSYTFTSSNTGVGTFVKPSATGSQTPALTAAGKTIPSSTSGLFCGYNAGTTTVSVTSGLLTASLPVTVDDGPVGEPCGTVTYAADDQVVTLAGKVVSTSGGVGAAASPVSPAASPSVHSVSPKLTSVPPPPPAKIPQVVSHPPVHAAPAPVPPFVVGASATQSVSAAVTPPIPPPLTPVPPGGATAPAQSTAKREEKARKEASQSAYVTRPAGSGEDWFYAVAGAVSILAVALIGGGLRPGPRREPALLELRETDDQLRRRRYP